MRAVRIRLIVAAAGLVLSTTGCLAWRVESLPAAELLKRNNVPALRIAKPDKSRVEVWDPHLSGDSIVGHPTERAIARVAVPLGDITTIETRHKSFTKTVLVTLIIAGGVGVYALLQSLNQGY